MTCSTVLRRAAALRHHHHQHHRLLHPRGIFPVTTTLGRPTTRPPLFLGQQTRLVSSINNDADDDSTTRNNEQQQYYWKQIMDQQQQKLQAFASFNPVLAWLQSQQQKLPKGFENFFPKQGSAKPDDPTSDNTTTKEDSTTNNNNKTTDKQQGFQFGSNENDKQQKKKKQPPPPPPLNDDSESTPGLIAMLLLVLLLRNVVESDKHGIQHAQKEVTFAEFRREYLAKGRVDRLELVNQTVAKVYLKPATASAMDDLPQPTTADSEFSSAGTSLEQLTQQHPHSNNNNNNHHKEPFVYFFIGSVESLEEKLAKAQQEWHPADWIEVLYVTHTNWALESLKLLPALAMMMSAWYIMRLFNGSGSMFGGKSGSGGTKDNKNIFGIGKSTAKKITPADVNTTFADVAGCQQAKMEVMEFVDFLQHPARFQKLGAKIPKGALLCGPPGTGKTLLAKAVAGEAGVPFYSISGSDFIEMFVGVGPSRVRDLFKEARQNSPCIVFIDEIDAVGRQRGRGGFSGGNDERENTLNQLLVEMDGFSSSTNVVVLAGTNRADILDQALTRPGRFDRQIQVDKPDLQGRKEIFLVHLKGIKLQGDKSEYAGRLAGLTPGFAGADIANLVNEAAIVAARRKGKSVIIDDFEKATDRIIGGLESNKIMSDTEKSIVAHHEAGHAVAGWFLEHADPLLKVTIIPRSSGALGFAQYLPKEVFLRSRDQIMDIVCMALAGRAAEQVFFGEVTTGASDDLRRVTQLVYSTIKVFGMNSRLGQLAFPDSDNQNPGDKKYSESTAEAMDEEARAIVNEAYQRTIDLITERKEEVAKVAQLLRDKETITHDDIVDLIGARPYGDKAYQEYISSKAAITITPSPDAADTAEESNNEDDTTTTTLTPGLA